MAAEELKIKITADNSQAQGVLGKTANAIGQFSSKVKKAGIAVAKATGAAIVAGGAAVVALTKQAVEAYADYEQLSGGVEKLFGKDAQTMLSYAQNAYRTAGMSANQYLELSTSFAASLIQSYGGDTSKAVEMTDVAMRAISDNFNTFGGDIQSIQNAFQGFAKGNYTMLDNLKLGYGGTRAEMERLIADANEYAESIGMAGDLTIENFGDIVKAIDLVQQKQGIAGTTAKEAATTISGSLMMVKAAWANLLVAFADGNADLEGAFNALVESAEIAFNNILPVVEQALMGIGTLIEGLAPVLGEKLPKIVADVMPSLMGAITGLIQSLATSLPAMIQPVLSAIIAALPDLISAGIQLFAGLVVALVESIPQLVAAIPQIVEAIYEGFVAAAPQLKEAGIALINMVGEGITEAGEWLLEGIHTLWTDVLGGTEESWTSIVESLNTTWDSIKTSLSECWESIKTSLSSIWESIKTIAMAVFNALQEFWATWGGTIMTYIQAVWNYITTVFSSAFNIISALFKVFAALFSGDWGALWEAVKGLVEAVWNGIKDTLTAIWEGISSVAVSIWNTLSGILSGIWSSISATVSSVWNSIKSTISSVWNGIKSTVSSAINSVSSTVSSVFNSIKSTATSVWNSIKSAITTPIETAKEKVRSAIEKIKSFFNFSWSLPHLKMPHITITGEFSLVPPSVPHFSIEWYKLGGVFDSATLFGYGNGKIGGLGEDGAEAIVPLENNLEWLDRLATMLADKMGTDRPIILEVDGKVFGQIACDSINGLTRQTGRLNIALV